MKLNEISYETNRTTKSMPQIGLEAVSGALRKN